MTAEYYLFLSTLLIVVKPHDTVLEQKTRLSETSPQSKKKTLFFRRSPFIFGKPQKKREQKNLKRKKNISKNKFIKSKSVRF